MAVKPIPDGYHSVTPYLVAKGQDRRAFVVVGQALAAEFDGEAGTFDAILRSFRIR